MLLSIRHAVAQAFLQTVQRQRLAPNEAGQNEP